MHMRRIILSLFVFGLLTAARGQNASGTEADRTYNKALLHATAAYEDLVDPALANDSAKIEKFLAVGDQEAPAIVKMLPNAAATNFEKLRRSLHQSAAMKDGRGVAAASVEVFKVLADHLKADALVVPVEVELMDYSGYKLQVLAAADHPDWTAISEVAAQNASWWQAIAKSRVTNKQLRASVTSAVRGAEQAAKEKNVSMLKFGAQMVLDLVDVVEIQFKYPTALAQKPTPSAPIPKP
jgi:hypothetical protein